MPSIIQERRDSVAIIRLNRPEKFNALTRADDSRPQRYLH